MAQRIRAFDSLLLAVVVVVGIALRAYDLDGPLLWEDEAESAINALTILEHGFPVDNYLGLPIYENTLLEPWPESEEYEFRDFSYSDRGVAVYHGWLPLYSMAASFWWFGITPDEIAATPRVLHGSEEAPPRTMAPRVPAIVFSAIFLVALFFLARSVHSADAAWAAVTIAALADNLVYFGRNARYYSATLALVTLCALALWRLSERQRWRDFAYAALALVGLFHTHVLSFAAMTLVFAAIWFRMRQASRILPKLVLFAAILGTGTVPWMLWSGFLESVSANPRGWPLLDFPADLIAYLGERWPLVLVVAAGLVVSVSSLRAGRLPRHIIEPLAGRRKGMFFLILWGVGSFVVFVTLTPAASFFENRLSLMTAVPGLILFCAALVTLSQVLGIRRLWVHALLLGLGIFAATGRISLVALETRSSDRPFLAFIDSAEEWEFRPDTRIYADPNRHLILAYYSGLPVQSIAPVRSTFLNRTPDSVVIIDTTSASPPLPVEKVIQEARSAGVELSESDARRVMRELNVALVGQRLQGKVRAQWPAVRELTHLEKELAGAQAQALQVEFSELKRSAPIFRGYDLQNWGDWWAVFFYRFSGVEDRWRENLNFNERIRDATAWVFPWGWVLYDSSRGGVQVPGLNIDQGVSDWQ